MFRRSFTAIILAFCLVLTGCGTDGAEQSAQDADSDNTETTETATADIDKGSDKDAKNEEPQNEDHNDADDAEKHEKDTDSNLDDAESSSSLKTLTVQYINAGQADATLFQYTDNSEPYTLLFDTGDWQRDDVATYLANQNRGLAARRRGNLPGEPEYRRH